ncbi:MAG TPA: HEAT repeat domain-containing protein [Ktedonobacteraceae bacterium]|nr:HEAT repeat domain-containing protein [Ktedonobacteraceae bacterium]
MEKKGARLFQQETGIPVYGWNIVELESRRQLRQKINELIGQSYNSTLTTSEMRDQLLRGAAAFGNSFATQLVRSLQCDDPQKRQHIVWLLTLLDNKESIPLLQRLSHDKRLSRPVRLSAALALAGMGATAETIDTQPRVRLYAIG